MKQINEIQPKKCESGDVVERLRKIFLIQNRSSKSYRQIKVQGRTFFILLVAIYLSHDDVRAVPANDAMLGIPHHRTSNFDFGPPEPAQQLVSMSPAYQGASLGPDDSEDVELVKKWRGLYPFEYNPNVLNDLLQNYIEEESDNLDADSNEDPMSTLSESKRAPSYNSWRKGKRAPSYNSWRKGKRAPSSRQIYPELYKRAPSYNSWRKGGKRAPSYNSWRTGKRAPSYDSWRTGKKRVPSYSSWSAGKRVPSYNSWRKGKRSSNNEIKNEHKQDGLPTSMADKRVPTYNSWRKGKRGPAYNSWRKGKRFLNQLASNEPNDEPSEEKKSVENDVSAI